MIKTSKMTYQLNSPNNHHHNMVKKAIQRITSLVSSAVVPPQCSDISGASSSHRWDASSSSHVSCNYTPTYWHMHTSMAITTITSIHLCPLAWRHLSTISLRNNKPSLNTAEKHLSQRPPPNIISAGISG
jgi:hypothetical protein